MRSLLVQTPHRIVEYNSPQRRLWIFGQRCHHGATGSLLATLACVGMLSDPPSPTRLAPLVALAATGGVLMAHDWKDHTIWFERGRGTQP